MVREESGLPRSPLPPCAPAAHVKLFNSGETRFGPDPLNIQYNWRGFLAKCKWNRQATALLAKEYHTLFQEQQIIHNGRALIYDLTIDTNRIRKTIQTRLNRMQMHWKNENIPQHASPDDSDDNIDMNGARGAPHTPEELAIDRAASTRRQRRAALV